MGPRNLIILFFSTVAVSLVLLIIIFGLFFKNVDLSFDTKMPDAAPDLENYYRPDGKPAESRADGAKANLNVPGDAPPSSMSNANTRSAVNDGVGAPVDEETQEAVKEAQDANDNGQESEGQTSQDNGAAPVSVTPSRPSSITPAPTPPRPLMPVPPTPAKPHRIDIEQDSAPTPQ